MTRCACIDPSKHCFLDAYYSTPKSVLPEIKAKHGRTAAAEKSHTLRYVSPFVLLPIVQRSANEKSDAAYTAVYT